MRQLGRVGIVALLIAVATASSARAVNVVIDYTYDSNNFFASGSPARASLDSAASLFSGLLTDSLAAIVPPAPYQSSVNVSTNVTWEWTAQISHPSSGESFTITSPAVPANAYVIYAGARSLASGTLGVGGPGGWSWNTSINGPNQFSSQDITNINSITNSFADLIDRRNQPSGDFSNWGGQITFDNDGSTIWHLDHTTPSVTGTNDLYSVAVHELAHALGFGVSSEWNALRSGNEFIGSRAAAANGGSNPLLDGGGGHWENGTASTVLGTTLAREAAMDPSITQGTRKFLTTLDAAALGDIGWNVSLPAIRTSGDFTGNGIVDAADFTLYRDTAGVIGITAADGDLSRLVNGGDFNLWRANFGATGSASLTSTAVPEPATLLQLGSLALLFLAIRPTPTLRRAG